MKVIPKLLGAKQKEMLQLLKEIVEKESPSRDKRLNDQLGVWLAEQFERLTGGEVEVIVNEVYGNIVKGVWGQGEKQILLLSHYDTVWPKGTIQTMPFRIKDGKAYGPGSFDMKSGIIQGLFAVNALRELNVKFVKKIVFLFTSDEELGSPKSRKIIEEEAAKSDAVLVLEPSNNKEGALKTSRKGVAKFHLSIKGRPAHAGIEPEKGISAIEEMAKQIQYLHGLTDMDIGTTINVGIMHGGTTRNVIAGEAQADIDVRVKTQEEFNRVLPLIQHLQPFDERTHLEVKGRITRPPFERTQDTCDLFIKAKRIASEYLNVELTECETGGGSDGSLTSKFVPTLDGLGAVGAGAHADYEHVVIEEMPKRSALLAMLLIELDNEK